MSSTALKIEESTPSAIRQSLAKGQSTNPAIQRLRSRVLTESDVGQVITSYDRMHHRHNRS
ncbi:YhhA family cyclophane-containing RiPP [Pseudomonas sp. 22526]|uniref:YhhA family cyclophane-containing RiPP n=1 Tax=Pseudomonas sp. 22526 TaxID=3453937 RepID=UPI003F83443E